MLDADPFLVDTDRLLEGIVGRGAAAVASISPRSRTSPAGRGGKKKKKKAKGQGEEGASKVTEEREAGTETTKVLEEGDAIGVSDLPAVWEHGGGGGDDDEEEEEKVEVVSQAVGDLDVGSVVAGGACHHVTLCREGGRCVGGFDGGREEDGFSAVRCFTEGEEKES